jgi:hypothetical protein
VSRKIHYGVTTLYMHRASTLCKRWEESRYVTGKVSQVTCENCLRALQKMGRQASAKKIHYHLYHITMEATSKTACGMKLKDHVTSYIDEVTCCSCLRRLRKIGTMATKTLMRIKKAWEKKHGL